MPDWISLYHRLPYPLRSAAVSARGYWLRTWRYGGRIDVLVEEALERDSWSPQRWNQWREERLSRVLHRAATRVPYYRQHWAERKRRGDSAPWDVLENWPILRKEQIREQPKAFVADGCNPKRMYHLQTSGTTGTPLHLWRSRETDRRWYALYEARHRRWNSVSFRDRWAIVGGQLVAPVQQNTPPFWVWNAGLRQLYMSSVHLAPAHISSYVEAMKSHRVTFLLGYASALHSIASGMLEQDIAPPPLRVILSNAEPLYDHQRAIISEAFGCPVLDAYGMCEIVTAASECPYGSMHLWPEVGILEVLRDDAPTHVPAGETGRFVATGLLNIDMPLVRYEIGDLGSRARQSETCTCGRALPILQHIEGRLDDVIITPDGRSVGRLDPVFKSDLPIREAQVLQIDATHLEVRIVPTDDYMKSEHDDLIIRGLRDRVGPMDIVVSKHDKIPRTANGKLRAVVSKIARTPIGEA